MARLCGECGHDVTALPVQAGGRLCPRCGARGRGVRAAFGFGGAVRRAVGKPLLWVGPVLVMALLPLFRLSMEGEMAGQVVGFLFCAGTVHAAVQTAVVAGCWPRTRPRRGRWVVRAGVVASAAVVWAGVWMVLPIGVMYSPVLTQIRWVLFGD